MKYVIYRTINQFDIPKVEKILSDKKINFFFKNSYESSIIAGWANPGALFNESLLFVDKEKLIETHSLLSSYF